MRCLPIPNFTGTDATIRMGGPIEQDFGAQADRYRRRTRLFLMLFVCAVVLVAAALVVPDRWSMWVGVPGVALMVAALAVRFMSGGLRCPACGKSAEDFDRFCPVCGADGLRRHQVTAAQCDSCHRTLGDYKGRNYSIHFCTHCGQLLDARGV